MSSKPKNLKQFVNLIQDAIKYTDEAVKKMSPTKIPKLEKSEILKNMGNLGKPEKTEKTEISKNTGKSGNADKLEIPQKMEISEISELNWLAKTYFKDIPREIVKLGIFPLFGSTFIPPDFYGISDDDLANYLYCIIVGNNKKGPVFGILYRDRLIKLLENSVKTGKLFHLLIGYFCIGEFGKTYVTDFVKAHQKNKISMESLCIVCILDDLLEHFYFSLMDEKRYDIVIKMIPTILMRTVDLDLTNRLDLLTLKFTSWQNNKILSQPTFIKRINTIVSNSISHLKVINNTKYVDLLDDITFNISQKKINCIDFYYSFIDPFREVYYDKMKPLIPESGLETQKKLVVRTLSKSSILALCELHILSVVRRAYKDFDLQEKARLLFIFVFLYNLINSSDLLPHIYVILKMLHLRITDLNLTNYNVTLLAAIPDDDIKTINSLLNEWKISVVKTFSKKEMNNFKIPIMPMNKIKISEMRQKLKLQVS